ncbi:alcohol dehydrogenase catalytic domain-containing protein, partial [Salmonella enterica subsp. enterica serovar Muenster]|nr:alcohol dehydrogenase catalytic domain-containing protein [Salmonella enterica subsp. enterica serovar Muenster]
SDLLREGQPVAINPSKPCGHCKYCLQHEENHCTEMRFFGSAMFWENQLQMPALNRGFVALFLLLLMAFVIWFGKDLMVKVMSYL